MMPHSRDNCPPSARDSARQGGEKPQLCEAELSPLDRDSAAPADARPAVTIGLVGDYHGEVAAHRAIQCSIFLAERERPLVRIETIWIPTDSAPDQASELLRRCAGIWCVPASPYASMAGALAAIRFAREGRVPFLGTCAGFQHTAIEYARSILGMEDADHEETNATGACPVVARLEHPLVETQAEVSLVHGSRLQMICGADRLRETYHCNFGLIAKWAERLEIAGLRTSARGQDGVAHAVELDGHPFFLATLFQPERRALEGELHPIARAFMQAASDRADTARLGTR